MQGIPTSEVSPLSFPFPQAVPILDRLIEAGFEAYVVGGAIRDYLLGRPVHDVDIATSAVPHEVVRLFRHTVPIGIRHGTVAVIHQGKNFEVTTFRSESRYDDYRHPNEVRFEKSLEKDLMRRDFTINALAMAHDGTLIDPFGGRRDIANRRIRTVGEASARIAEDPLRMMRGIRFVSELDFSLGAGEEKAFASQAPMLRHISVERIDQEMTRLLDGPAVAAALRLLYRTQCLNALPLLESAQGERTFDTVCFDRLTSNAERWTVFLIRAVPALKTADFARAWNWSGRRRKTVEAIRRALFFRESQSWSRYALYRTGPDVAESAERVHAAVECASSDQLTTQIKRIQQLWDSCAIKQRGDLAAGARQFMEWSDTPPGPWLAETIASLEKDVIDGVVPNQREAIAGWFKANHKIRKS
jgi:tRNA nucleotidyltransferase (CCA-adding enzyme)